MNGCSETFSTVLWLENKGQGNQNWYDRVVLNKRGSLESLKEHMDSAQGKLPNLGMNLIWKGRQYLPWSTQQRQK